MNTIGDSLTQLQIEFEERLRTMARQQQEAVALAFAMQRHQANQENKLFRHLSAAFLTEASYWLKYKLQGKLSMARNVRLSEEEALTLGLEQANALIVDAEYRVIEVDPKPGQTTQEVTVWVS